jgi:hypothetical protein
MWVRDNTTQADYSRDMAQCQDKATATIIDYSSGQQYRTTDQLAGVITGEWITVAMNRPELIRLCMVARGYTAQSGDQYHAAAQPTVYPASTTPTKPAAYPASTTPTTLPLESKYMLLAEKFVKDYCPQPVATMQSKEPNNEIFTIYCPDGVMNVRCVDGVCSRLN